MFKTQMIKVKEMLNNDNGNNKKKIENLVAFIIILIITIIVINVILKDDKNNNMQNITSSKTLAKSENSENKKENVSDLKNDLEYILSKIDGVGEVKVLITYSQTNQLIPLFNEDTSTSDTDESDSGGGNRKIKETSNKKEVIYQEINGEKIPVTQSTINPKVEGAIVIAKGASNSDIKLKITHAVEAATGLATHKIQVFPMTNK